MSEPEAHYEVESIRTGSPYGYVDKPYTFDTLEAARRYQKAVDGGEVRSRIVRVTHAGRAPEGDDPDLAQQMADLEAARHSARPLFSRAPEEEEKHG